MYNVASLATNKQRLVNSYDLSPFVHLAKELAGINPHCAVKDYWSKGEREKDKRSSGFRMNEARRERSPVYPKILWVFSLSSG